MIQEIQEYNQMYSNPFFSKELSLKGLENEIKVINSNKEVIGHYTIQNNIYNELTYVEYVPEVLVLPEIEDKLALHSVSFVFLVDNNIRRVVNVMNDGWASELNLTLKLD